jgi:hypothetical protein
MLSEVSSGLFMNQHKCLFFPQVMVVHLVNNTAQTTANLDKE